MPVGAFYGQEATMPVGAFYGQEPNMIIEKSMRKPQTFTYHSQFGLSEPHQLVLKAVQPQ
jgi:hypothetical protein